MPIVIQRFQERFQPTPTIAFAIIGFHEESARNNRIIQRSGSLVERYQVLGSLQAVESECEDHLITYFRVQAVKQTENETTS